MQTRHSLSYTGNKSNHSFPQLAENTLTTYLRLLGWEQDPSQVPQVIGSTAGMSRTRTAHETAVVCHSVQTLQTYAASVCSELEEDQASRRMYASPFLDACA